MTQEIQKFNFQKSYNFLSPVRLPVPPHLHLFELTVSIVLQIFYVCQYFFLKKLKMFTMIRYSLTFNNKFVIMNSHFFKEEKGMQVINKTSHPLKILGETLRPNMARSYEMKSFDSLHISCKIGRCVVITENGKRRFRSHGKLEVREGNKKDENGRKVILVFNRN